MCRPVQQQSKDTKLPNNIAMLLPKTPAAALAARAAVAEKEQPKSDLYDGSIADWKRDMLDPNSKANINNKFKVPLSPNRHVSKIEDAPKTDDIVSQMVVAQPSLEEDSTEPTNKARKKVRGFNDLISSIKSGTLLGGLIGGKDTLG